jgi:Ribbon-helix-helix protein, copG family
MKTVSFKLPATLNVQLERAAKKRGQHKSEIVRTALELYLNGTPTEPRAASALELAGDLVGRGKGPGDLSTNRKYMEGFGK